MCSYEMHRNPTVPSVQLNDISHSFASLLSLTLSPVFSLWGFHHVLFTRLTKRILYTGNACDCEFLSSNVGKFIYFNKHSWFAQRWPHTVKLFQMSVRLSYKSIFRLGCSVCNDAVSRALWFHAGVSLQQVEAQRGSSRTFSVIRLYCMCA